MQGQTRTRRQFGYIRKLPSGRYQGSYWHLGKRWPADRTFKGRTEAGSWLARKQTEIEDGSWTDPTAGKKTVPELAAAWLSSNPGKAASTLAVDQDTVRLHISPSFGGRAIRSVTQPDIQAWVNLLVAKGLAPKTVKRAYGVLRACFAYAVNADWLARSPCRGVKLPAVVNRKRHAITPEELAALADAVGPAYAPMLYLGAMGLRWSEVAGLKVGALRLLASTITVEEALVRTAHNEKVTKTPKSDAGHRTLTIPDDIRDLLAAHLSRRGLSATTPDALVFTHAEGGTLDYSRWRRRTWMPACEEVGLAGLGFHDLRRMAASALVSAGIDMKTAQVRLGHADARMTLGLYAQATRSDDREAAARLGDYLKSRRFSGLPDPGSPLG